MLASQKYYHLVHLGCNCTMDTFYETATPEQIKEFAVTKDDNFNTYFPGHKIAMAPPLADEAGARQAPSFAGGLALSLINPKGYAAMAALFSSFALVRDRLVFDAALKIGR